MTCRTQWHGCILETRLMTLLHAKLLIEDLVAFYLQMACKHDLLASFLYLDRMPIYLRWMLEVLRCLQAVDASMVHVVNVESSFTHLRMGTLKTHKMKEGYFCVHLSHFLVLTWRIFTTLFLKMSYIIGSICFMWTWVKRFKDVALAIRFEGLASCFVQACFGNFWGIREDHVGHVLLWSYF